MAVVREGGLLTPQLVEAGICDGDIQQTGGGNTVCANASGGYVRGADTS